MKKLHKNFHSKNQTVESMACNCSISCLCACSCDVSFTNSVNRLPGESHYYDRYYDALALAATFGV